MSECTTDNQLVISPILHTPRVRYIHLLHSYKVRNSPRFQTPLVLPCFRKKDFVKSREVFNLCLSGHTGNLEFFSAKWSGHCLT